MFYRISIMSFTTKNALEAYRVLATNFGVKDDEIIDYFQDESLMSFLLKLCLFPFANNSACTGEEMRECRLSYLFNFSKSRCLNMEFLNSIQSSVWFAMSGALAIKLLELAELHKVPTEERPDFKDLLYWLPFFILPLLGGGLAFVYVSSNTLLSPILAVNVGLSAPLMLRAMAQAIPIDPPVIKTPPDA